MGVLHKLGEGTALTKLGRELTATGVDVEDGGGEEEGGGWRREGGGGGRGGGGGG